MFRHLMMSLHLKIQKVLFDYRIHSSESRRRSFNFDSSKGGAYSREAIIKYIKKTSKYFQLVFLIKQ